MKWLILGNPDLNIVLVVVKLEHIALNALHSLVSVHCCHNVYVFETLQYLYHNQQLKWIIIHDKELESSLCSLRILEALRIVIQILLFRFQR